MALNDPLHRIDTVNLDQEKPVLPWLTADFDGFSKRNQHERALGDRDNLLLDLLRSLKQHGSSNVSPLFPFREDATLVPSSAIALDASGLEIPDFTISPSSLILSNSFIRDLKLVLTTEFSQPFLSKISLVKKVDPETSLVQIFTDIEISARYSGDQVDYPILSLTSKAFNDVQNNSNPSSKDGVAFDLTSLEVSSREWLTSGVITFGFIGAVQSTTSSSWSVGSYNGAKIEGFSALPTLKTINFTFTRPSAGITELAYMKLADLRKAIPFLSKILNYPFSQYAVIGDILAKYILDISISGPKEDVYLKRIRKDGSNYIFVFAYDEKDLNGDYLATVNIGIATATNSGTFTIESLGSNRLAGADPDWVDEVANSKDSYGVGTLTISNIEGLYEELLGTPIGVGSPSPIEVSPVSPGEVVGLFVDPDIIAMVSANSTLNSLVVSINGVNLTVTERTLSNSHYTRNIKVSVDNAIINRRTTYGPEVLMRDFYGILGTESLIDNDKIPLDDEWFDTTANVLRRYQVIQGAKRWKAQ